MTNSETDRSRLHVAGVVDADEAEMLIDCGVGFLGFPLVLGYHREDLSVDAAAAIVTRFAKRATFFLITYLNTASEILTLCRALGVDMVQLHGDLALEAAPDRTLTLAAVAGPFRSPRWPPRGGASPAPPPTTAGGKRCIPFVYFCGCFVYCRYASVALKPLIRNKTRRRKMWEVYKSIQK